MQLSGIIVAQNVSEFYQQHISSDVATFFHDEILIYI